MSRNLREIWGNFSCLISTSNHQISFEEFWTHGSLINNVFATEKQKSLKSFNSYNIFFAFFPNKSGITEYTNIAYII